MRRPSPSLGVDWHLPGQQRRFATTTTATSDLIRFLGEDGHTFAQAAALIHYDPDAAAVVKHFCLHGYADTPIAQLVR